MILNYGFGTMTATTFQNKKKTTKKKKNTLKTAFFKNLKKKTYRGGGGGLFFRKTLVNQANFFPSFYKSQILPSINK